MWYVDPGAWLWTCRYPRSLLVSALCSVLSCCCSVVLGSPLLCSPLLCSSVRRQSTETVIRDGEPGTAASTSRSSFRSSLCSALSFLSLYVMFRLRVQGILAGCLPLCLSRKGLEQHEAQLAAGQRQHARRAVVNVGVLTVCVCVCVCPCVCVYVCVCVCVCVCVFAHSCSPSLRLQGQPTLVRRGTAEVDVECSPAVYIQGGLPLLRLPSEWPATGV